MTTAPRDFVASFHDSMPDSYRSQHALTEVHEHAGIVQRRGDRLVHAEIWKKTLNAVVVCLVTDDRPRLLSLISATIVAHGLEVVAAEVYCRTAENGRVEAIDFLWLRHNPDAGEVRPSAESDVASIAASLAEMLKGEVDFETVLQRGSTRPPAPTPLEVSFLDDGGDVSVLTIETADRAGLLMRITSVLSAEGVRVVESAVTTVGNRARDRFHITAADGGPLVRERREAVRQAVLAALRDSPMPQSRP